jgi:hypothetical protein
MSFNLYFHNSDYGFEAKHLCLCNISNLNKVYSQNLMILPSIKVHPLPIGFANQMWDHGNIELISNCLKNTEAKSNSVYFFFDVHTNFQERSECYQIVTTKKLENQPKLPFKKYLQLLSTFEYAICPIGNGLDTHRFWECLYLKTIPICKRNIITEYYSKWFPVFLLNDWNDLDISLLNYKNETWDNYSLLDMNSMIEFK